jgi:creatinine amidohydrolase
MSQSRRGVDIADLTWPEYEAQVGAGAPVFLPVGSLEQHGRHLPLDTDTLIAQEFAQRVASEIGGLVLPPIAYGARSLARSGGGDVFPGTVNLGGETLTNLIFDVLAEQYRHGVRRMVVMLGHGENDPFCIEGVAALQSRLPGNLPTVLVAGWWHVVSTEDVKPMFPEGFPGWDLEHAARVETALMLAMAPGRVRLDAIGPIDPVVATPYTVLPTPARAVPSQGSLSDPRGATATAGQALIDVAVSRLSARIRELFGLTGQEGSGPGH